MAPTPITATEAKAMYDRGEAIFVDARNPTAWGTSDVKLPGAVRVPANEAAERAGAVPRERAAIAYCT
ncbi:MAG TPA: rhodanese-like domain-containing protein [Gemmatimonadota bacterium]|nr:rhodanese-like domain-containing protein [Gemmatimonadota bacterium]